MQIVNLPPITKNIRYLLWLKDHDYTKWPGLIKKALGPAKDDHIEKLLAGTEPTPDELGRICDRFGAEQDVLRNDGFICPDPKDMVKKNMVYLMGELPHGSQKDLTSLLKMRKETVSRWATGKVAPTKCHRRELLRFVGVPEHIDIEKVPLFLSIEPLGIFQQRAWIRGRLDALGAEELAQFFPALEKLLKPK
jgi:transcriptional regulator with XRE-family HTH domain